MIDLIHEKFFVFGGGHLGIGHEGSRRKTMFKYFTIAFGLLVASTFTVGAAEQPASEEPLVQKPAVDNPAVKEPYIKLKPADDIYKIVVLGDSLANGLYQGLTQINKDNDLLKTTRKSKVNTGLVRVDRYNWNKGAKKIAASGKYQIAIVLIGLNDMQSIREKGKAHHFQTEGWEERYRARTEAMMADLKKTGLAVYWTGIPITAPERFQKEYDYLNAFYKAAAKKLDVRYVDTWAVLSGPKGEYSPFWKTADGKLQEIRRKDGVHFTPDGYQIFAGIVNDIMLEDLKSVMKKPVSQ